MGTRLTPEAFWTRVQCGAPDQCWNWQGATNSTGYGNLSYQGSAVTAHRVAAFLVGLVPTLKAPTDRKQGGFIMHSCDNRSCCNPAHMRVGTYTQNQLEAYSRNRRKAFRGEAHTNAKLTNRAAELVRELYAHSVPQDSIAALMGVSQSSVSNILLGKTYVGTV